MSSFNAAYFIVIFIVWSLTYCHTLDIPQGVPPRLGDVETLQSVEPRNLQLGIAESRPNNLLPPGTNNIDEDIAPAKRRPLANKIARLIDDPDCYEDFKNLCGKDVTNNFGILECIQNKGKSESDFLNSKCHHLLWTYKMNLTTSGRIEGMARDLCESEIARFPQCQDLSMPGHTLTCMTQYLNELQDEKCHQYLNKLAAIIFGDYRLISHMTATCSEDIGKQQCGRLQSMVEPSMHSQGYVIECLGKNTDKLSQECHQQILRLAELQADDFHLDRPLYFACRDDRENFCRNVRAGHGRVYKCLMKHKMERTMSKECFEKLSNRQHLVQEDYQVSQGLAKTCRVAIQNLNCRRGIKEGLGHSVKLAAILLCLEDGLRRGSNIDTSCQEEMLQHRRMLLEDYQLSPDLVVACRAELKRLCGGGKELGGRTLHCLMKHARQHPKRGRDQESKLSPECKRRVEDAVKVSDAGEDWRIDPVLHEACQPVVERACPTMLGGQARVMHCLMGHLGTPIMTVPCESALLEIQYFVARDWKLDPQLYSACYNDSVTKCHAKRTWATMGQDADPERGVLVLPCLFRNSYDSNPENRISEQCSEEVRRIMHERAAYVDLHPEIEAACLKQLATYCQDSTKPGQELLCLQENLESLPEDCRTVVANYTAAEAQDVQLNSLITTHCATLIPQMCGEQARQSAGQDDGVMDCLIQHKNSPVMRENGKCRAVVENFQVISMKDISFTPKFKRDCHQDVLHFCAKSKSKKDVVDCLSTHIRDDILNDDRPQVSRPCRVQLRNQLLQRHTSAHLDPDLHANCRQDIQNTCATVPLNRPEMVLECLRSHHKQLSVRCHEVVFARVKEELLDPGTDPVLLQACDQMIRMHCANVNKEELLICLKREKNGPAFDQQCRHVVVSRMIEQNSDARLNPQLLSACHLDVARHCQSVFDKFKTSKTEMNGKLIACLQESLARHVLTAGCSREVVQITREAAFNHKMDARLTEACDDEIQLLCRSEAAGEADGDQGAVEECMKLAMEQSRITNVNCLKHVAEIIETQRADLHADPQLHEACSIDDAKFCADQEAGQHLPCLFEVLNRNFAGLERRCRELLRRRREMFNKAVKVSPLESFDDIVQGVVSSSQRNYLLVIFVTIVGIIFLVGIVCGRTTRRYKLLKNR